MGFLDPEYRQTNGSVILTLRAVQRIESAELVGMPQNANQVLAILQAEPKGLGTGEMAERMGLSKPVVRKSLASLVDAGFVEWHGNLARDSCARWVAMPPLN